MILSEHEIRSMVAECVGRILEVHGAIDDRITGLAKLIIKKIRRGERSFSLTEKDVSKFYPYKGKISGGLNVIVGRDVCKQGAAMAYNPPTNTLKVKDYSLFFDDETLTSMIMHELTHFVNNVETDGRIFAGRSSIMASSEKEEYAKQIMYLFNDSERQARVTQFKHYLRTSSSPKISEQVTHLKTMQELINKVREDTYEEYVNGWENDEFGTITDILLFQRWWYKTSIDEKERIPNFMSKGDFEKTKSSTIARLTRYYNEYKKKIHKIYYDFLSES